jgi:hypothetical protein
MSKQLHKLMDKLEKTQSLNRYPLHISITPNFLAWLRNLNKKWRG